ncbi:MAG: hypothetical protein IJU27_07150 [Bacteroidales bacterium]|nr:hypothetical protein [Bacteroidales bacterium]
MLYYFILNGVKKPDEIRAGLEPQIAELGLESKFYVTTGVGDGTRFVRLYCDFHDDEEVCFVACGGSGTANEVANGIIGHKRKSMAIMPYGTTNDFIKYYPGRDFKDLRAMVEGETVQIDAIKCNDDYAINVLNFGFDAMVAYEANMLIEEGASDPYKRAVNRSIFRYRFNNYHIEADGERISKGFTLLCTVANARWCGGQFLTAPEAVVDDGLMDVCLIHSMSLASFLIIIPKYSMGEHLKNDYCRKRMTFRKARHFELSSRDLVRVSLDGEISASTHFVVDIVDKAVTLRLPSLPKEGVAV